MQPWATGSSLLNFAGCGNTAARIRSLFPAGDQERLLRIKREIDPQDMFRFGDPIGVD